MADQPVFVGIFKQSQATAALRTFTFLAVDVTDGFTPEPGLVYAGADNKISKNGGAQANLAGVVTEIAVGLYQVVLAAGDLDTLGTVVISFADAAARTVYVTLQVILMDLAIATIGPTAGSIVAASFGANAITAAKLDPDVAIEIAAEVAGGAVGDGVADLLTQTAPSRTTGPHSMGSRTTNGAFNPLSTVHAVDCDITVTGTWNGATATPETCADVTATVPVWVTYAGAAALTANGTIRVTGPHPGVRIALTGSGGATSLAASATMRSNT